MALDQTITAVDISDNRRSILSGTMQAAGFSPFSDLISLPNVARSILRKEAVEIIRSADKVEKIDWMGGAPLDGTIYRFTNKDNVAVDIEEAIDGREMWGGARLDNSHTF